MGEDDDLLIEALFESFFQECKLYNIIFFRV